MKLKDYKNSLECIIRRKKQELFCREYLDDDAVNIENDRVDPEWRDNRFEEKGDEIDAEKQLCALQSE